MDQTLPEFSINGWTFKIDHDPERPVSWVYKDVKNYDYHFANEISIEKIVVEVEQEDKSIETLSLKYSDFASLTDEELSGLKEYNPKLKTYGMNVANFAVYKGKGKLLAFKTRKNVLPAKEVKGEKVHERLYFFVTILFADYGTDPPHEFTGSLQAARFTPAIRFETKNEHVKSVRVDCRFHFNADSYLKDDSVLTPKASERAIENYASLLRDADHFPPSLLLVFQLLKDVLGLDLKFLNSKLADCGFDGNCRFETSGLDLQILGPGTRSGDRLDISFRDPRTVLSDATNAFKKAFVSVVDTKVKALTVGSAQEYDQATLDALAKRIFDAIVGVMKPAPVENFLGQAPNVFGEGTPLPGVTAACLLRNIKYLLVQLLIKHYLSQRAAIISKRLRLVRQATTTDLADTLKYLEPGDFAEVITDIESLAHAMVQAPRLPVVGEIWVLSRLAKLVESIQKLGGKLLSIASFVVAEKPVLHEAIGTYVRDGEVNDTWDNLHWWGTEEIPSSPGAFHAIHSHFRWTQLNTYPSAEEELVLELGNAIAGTKEKLHNKAPQFRSLVKKFASNSLSGPLIDPRIANQTIFLALVTNGGAVDKKLREKESHEPFDKIEGEPTKIATVSPSGNSGADIVYWLSCKAVRKDEAIFKGTLLVNGFYFAHDEEKPFSLFRAGNLFGLTQGVDLQKPKRDQPHLFRDPFS